MNKALRSFLAVLLCFCMVCSMCGVGFAAGGDYSVGDDTVAAPLPDVPAEPAVPPDPVPEVSLAPPPEVSLAPDPEVSLAPDPEASLAPAPEGPLDPGPEESAPAPGVGVSPFVPVLSGPSDVTYVELPEDFVIKSASLDDNYAIDPYSLAPVTPSSSSGLKAVLLSILGNYDPIVAQYQYNNGSNYGYIREIQPDYVWLASAAIFAILLYCTWRVFGGLVCRK